LTGGSGRIGCTEVIALVMMGGSNPIIWSMADMQRSEIRQVSVSFMLRSAKELHHRAR
jgi:hypothetical protein